MPGSETVAIYGSDLLAGFLAAILSADNEVFLLDGTNCVLPEVGVYPFGQGFEPGTKKYSSIQNIVAEYDIELNLSETKRDGYVVKTKQSPEESVLVAPELQNIKFKTVSPSECRKKEPRISTYLNKIEFSEDFYLRKEKKVWEKLRERLYENGGRIVPEHNLVFDTETGSWILRGQDSSLVDRLIFTGTWADDIRSSHDIFKKGRLQREVWINIETTTRSQPGNPWFNQNVAIFPVCEDRLLIRGRFWGDQSKKIMAGEVLEMFHKSYEVFPFIYEEKIENMDIRFRYYPDANGIFTGRITETTGVILAAGYSDTGLEVLGEVLKLISS